MNKYYSLKKINSKNATYNVIFGERSNGKTYACLEQALKNYFEHGKQFAYIRRWSDDIAPKRMNNLFNAMLDKVEKFSDGEFHSIIYRTGVFYLANYNKDGKAIYNDQDIIGYAFNLSASEHNKANSYPNITMIIFDEFLTNKYYLPDEFVLFMNTVSTIIRQRTDVKIYMLGNTVNKFCPYFGEMGLNNVLNQEQGTIDVYTYGKSKLKVAVEYANNNKLLKKNNYYFAFDNPKLKMITSGAWELNIYPHAPIKWRPKNELFHFFIIFNGITYQCDVISRDQYNFIFVHNKTTPIKRPDKDLIYSLDYHAGMNYNRNILRPKLELEKNIAFMFSHDMVYYQDNEVGEAISNYIKICRQGGI